MAYTKGKNKGKDSMAGLSGTERGPPDWQCYCGYVNHSWRAQCRYASEHQTKGGDKGPRARSVSFGPGLRGTGKARGGKSGGPPGQAPGVAETRAEAASRWGPQVRYQEEEPKKRMTEKVDETMQAMVAKSNELKKQIEGLEKFVGTNPLIEVALAGLKGEMEILKHRIKEEKPLAVRIQTAAAKLSKVVKEHAGLQLELEEAKEVVTKLELEMEAKVKEKAAIVEENTVLTKALETQNEKERESGGAQFRVNKELASEEIKDWMHGGEMDEEILALLAKRRLAKLAAQKLKESSNPETLPKSPEGDELMGGGASAGTVGRSEATQGPGQDNTTIASLEEQAGKLAALARGRDPQQEQFKVEEEPPVKIHKMGGA